MSIQFRNNASGTLSVQLDGATPGPEDTTLVLQANEGQLFPPVTTASGNFFYATVEDTSGNIEIVKCTDVSTDTFTVTRAQENTVSQTFAVGSKVELRSTAGTFDEFIQRTGGVMTDGPLDFNGNTLQDPVITSTGSAVIQNVPLRGSDNGTANQLQVPSAGADPTIGVNTIWHTGNDATLVQTSRQITTSEGITGGGDLSTNRDHKLDVNGLTALSGTDLTGDDAVVVYDSSGTTHKKILYKQDGIPIITDSTATPTPTDDQVNAFWRCTHSAAAITFTLGTGIGEQGNIILIEQADATQQVTIGGGATVRSTGASKRSTGQYAVMVLVCTSTDNWILYGDVE